MGEEKLVPSAAIKVENGIELGRNRMGLNGKKISSSAPESFLTEGKRLLKSEEILKGMDVPKRNGKSKGLNGKNVTAPPVIEGELQRGNALVSKHHPLLEGISKMINGCGKPKAVPAISEQQIADIAQYFYLAWLSKHRPLDEAVALELGAYTPQYYDAIITLKGNFATQGEGERVLLIEARKLALKAAKALIRKREQMETQISILEKGKEARLGELEREKAACEKWVNELYANREKFISGIVAKKVTPIEEFLKKFGLPTGGAIAIAGTAFKSAVADITEHIPLIAGVAPEIIGLGIVGLWALARISKSLVSWHLGSVKNGLPKKAERRKEAELKRIGRLQLEAEERHAERINEMHLEFECTRAGIVSDLKKEYSALLSQQAKTYGG